jgi:SAM-dependent methyltransferase
MYETIARYYDLIHAGLTADLTLIQQVARQTGGPILELGCGTGRLLRPLAAAGYRVTGVDNSTPMLDRLRQKLVGQTADRVTLLEGNMLALDKALGALNERFALVIFSYNTMMHLSLPQVTAVLRQLHPYLAEGGQVFIDVANPFYLAETADTPQLTLENQLTDPQTGDHVLQFASTRHDETEQICHVTWLFDSSPAAGGPVQRTISQMAYHYFYPHELELALKTADYTLHQLWGDYDQTPFHEASSRLLLLATH